MSHCTRTRAGSARVVLTSFIVPLILAACFALPQEAQAETATPAEMESVCRNWLSCIVYEQGSWAGEVHPTIKGVQEVVVNAKVLARCYSISPQGHVVVPVLKELPPVKVSSHECDLDVTGEVGFPQLLRELLQGLAGLFIDTYGSLEATQPQEGEVLFGRAHRRLWDHYLVDPDRFTAELAQGVPAPRTQVGPLLTTSWDQLDPYNNYCPMGDGGRCVVGCMTLATTQIMNYHKWPPKGIGGCSYEWVGDGSCGGDTENEILSADFYDPYDWDHMPNSCFLFPCTPEQQDAVAELNYEVGVAYQNYFGRCFTAPGTDDVDVVLSTYFRYSAMMEMETRGMHSAEGWFAIIQEEINNNRPMLYGFRYGPSGGHAIVCDGWRDAGGENQYHMNYGWGGSYTAWYAIDELYGHFNPADDVLWRYMMPGSGFVFQVRPDGSGFYPTIQAAIDDLLEGDIVELVDGIYTGDGNRDVDFHGMSITVRSQSGDPQRCIIDCRGNPEEHRGFRFVSGEGPSSVLEGITIANGYIAGSDGGGAILCANSSSPTIRNCLIRGNETQDGGGGIGCSGSSPTVTGCVLSLNATDNEGGAIRVLDGGQPNVANCTFYANAAAEGSGGALWVSSDSHAEVDNCIVVFGTGGGAIRCEGESPTAVLECCDIYGNVGGDWEGCIADQFGVGGNISEDPLFCDQENENFHLRTESPCGPDHNPACSLIGALPLGCGFYTVTPYGTGDYPTIQAAIDGCHDGDTIELTDGTYTGDGNRDLDYGGKAITIRSQSGDADLCVIDCEGGPTAQRRAFRFRSGEGTNSVLQGITIAHGYTQSYSGGAIWCSEGSAPTIDHCIFRDNHAGASGGAVYCSGGSNPALSYCTFYDNSAGNGGGIHAYGSEPTIINCTFAHNAASAHGAGICCMSGAATVQNTIIAFSTDGEGAHCYSGSFALSCCDVFGNEGGDWTGCIAGQEGQNGNIWADPLFCDPPSGNYRLSEGSPCAPFSPPNEECDLIGAWSVDCNLEAVDGDPDSAKGAYLAPNTPNPFGTATRITYMIPGSEGGVPVRLSIFDSSGRFVQALVDIDQSPGAHGVIWDGRNQAGVAVAGGIYFIQLHVDGLRQTKRAVLIR